jgi:hypothetical protein
MESHSILKNLFYHTVQAESTLSNRITKIRAVTAVETNDQYIVINLKYELDDIH